MNIYMIKARTPGERWFLVHGNLFTELREAKRAMKGFEEYNQRAKLNHEFRIVVGSVSGLKEVKA